MATKTKSFPKGRINIGDVLDVTPGLQDGQKICIVAAEISTDSQNRPVVTITDESGAKFHSFSKYIIEAIQALGEKGIDFAVNPVECAVKSRESEKGRVYLTLVPA